MLTPASAIIPGDLALLPGLILFQALDKPQPNGRFSPYDSRPLRWLALTMMSAGAVSGLSFLAAPRWLTHLGRNRFESVLKLSRVHCPVLVTHGSDDDVIPVGQGRALFRAANEPKQTDHRRGG